MACYHSNRPPFTLDNLTQFFVCMSICVMLNTAPATSLFTDLMFTNFSHSSAAEPMSNSDMSVNWDHSATQ